MPSLTPIPAAAARRRIIAYAFACGSALDELAGAAIDGAEQRPFGIASQPGVVEIGGEGFLEVAVARPRVALAAFRATPRSRDVRPLVCCSGQKSSIPPIPPPGGIAGAAFFSGFSATIASVVTSRPAIDAAFSKASRTTLVGSMMPALTMST